MDLLERHVAQIVRDFFEVWALSEEIGKRLLAGDLEFARVERFVGDSDESILHRLKEECHALFRANGDPSGEDLEAAELFDLAVGALFHEAMRFREGYYLTTSYGPRLDRMVEEGRDSGALALAFRRVFEAGHRRMLESFDQTRELLRESTEQLRTLLHHLRCSGLVARCLVDHRSRAEQAFGVPLPELLSELYGCAEQGYLAAVDSLLRHGHHAQAAALLERDDVRKLEASWTRAAPLARGLARYYGGDSVGALVELAPWLEDGAAGCIPWRDRAASVLAAIALGEGLESASLRERAADFGEKLSRCV
ncbi:MAG: hypothetical protein ACE5IL_08635 [Myxococcota bacterium]